MVGEHGVHAYLTGKFMSRTILIMIAVITIICYLDTLLLIILCHINTVIAKEYQDRTIIVTILAQVSLTTTVNLLLMQGFMNRNILQIILVSFFNGTTKLVLAWRSAEEVQNVFGTLLLAVSGSFVLFLFCTTIFGLLCRKEFGWFYYKTYGANINRNSVYTIRTALDAMFKVAAQLFICLWFSKYLLEIDGLFYLPVTVFQFIGVLSYIAEYRIESYLLRCTNITLNALVLTFRLLQLIDPFYIEDTGPGISDGTNFNGTYMLLDACNRVVIEVVYISLLILDIFSFGYGYTGSNRDMRKKRMALGDE
ncbi:hypothetical protein NEDG_01679 [Nematocida displodere]|uniref:Uncharacterized protein n=1 Tax=Nematocida displodere TaxID=1805483 RepID=A0A177EEG0_9MICR|nr:hypothetical protein NEDG_01679 [Nematocida displodere]